VTVRASSLEVYRELEAEGVLSAQAANVLRLVHANPGATAREIDRISTGNGTMPIRSLQPHLTRLRDQGAVREGDRRKCGVTGRRVLTYFVTGQRPTRAKRTTYGAKKKAEAVAVLKRAWVKANPRDRLVIAELGNWLKGES